MLTRYSLPEMVDIWSEKSKFEAWLKVELFATEAYAKVNKNISSQDIENLWKNCKVDVDRINELEKELKHDVIAFTRQVGENLGAEKQWLHYGLTSTDVVDTAQSFRLKKANELILEKLQELTNTIKALAIEHKYTFQMGRTHGIHAEVTTFGYKMALWFDEMQRNIDRFKEASKEVEVAKISGAVGNYANIPLSVQEYVADKLGLASSKISSQTLQRDRHANYIFTIALIGSSLDKFATEIRHLQRTEVREVFEKFTKGQKGSSAMPHKQNPIGSENISGLSRVLRGFVTSAMENIALWHERDISHSSCERVILPDATVLVHYMLSRFNGIMSNIIVDKEKMAKNIMLTSGTIYSQKALLILIDKKNYSREQAYDTIQPIAFESFENNIDFKQSLIDKNILTADELVDLYDNSYYTTNIDEVFSRLGL